MKRHGGVGSSARRAAANRPALPASLADKRRCDKSHLTKRPWRDKMGCREDLSSAFYPRDDSRPTTSKIPSRQNAEPFVTQARSSMSFLFGSGALLITLCLLSLFLSPGAASAQPRGMHVASPAQTSRSIADRGCGAATVACEVRHTTLGAVEGLRGFNSLLGHCPSLIFVAAALAIHCVAAPAVPVAEASPSAVVLPPDPPPPKDNVKTCS